MRLGRAKSLGHSGERNAPGVDVKIFDSVRRKFVRASVGWGKSQSCRCLSKSFSQFKTMQQCIGTAMYASDVKPADPTSVSEARHLVLTEEFDPGSE